MNRRYKTILVAFLILLTQNLASFSLEILQCRGISTVSLIPVVYKISSFFRTEEYDFGSLSFWSMRVGPSSGHSSRRLVDSKTPVRSIPRH